MEEDHASTARPAGLWEVPELPVAFFSFLLHFVWEFVQVPAFSGMAEMGHWQAIKLCLSATIGDVGFALTAFWVASLAARSRDWVLEPTRLPLVLWIWQASEVLEATARHAIYGVQWRRLDRKWLGLLKDRSRV